MVVSESVPRTLMAVVIVNHETREHLRACLESLRSETAAEMPAVMVADTGSADGSAEMVRRDFPEVKLLADGGNPGFGAAVNRAVALCDSPFVLLLNADTRVAPGALGKLADYLVRHPRAAVAGPRLVNPDGTLQVSCFPFIGTLQLMIEKTPLGRWLARVPVLRDRWLLSHSSHDRPRVVPWVLGAALAIRRESFEEVGGFDPAFFMYSEEIDLCYRLSAIGWEVHFAPVTDVTHVGGASTGQRRPEMAVRRVASSKLFYRRHYSRLRVLLLEGMISAAMLARLGRDSLRLAFSRDSRRRSRLAEDLTIWLGALRGSS
jgi:N-acetylglucosaminyl-diphospho-decaprenol L-rhamnosyltransferase